MLLSFIAGLVLAIKGRKLPTDNDPYSIDWDCYSTE
jgi:hypothetical protein